jgi:hypothetical protein
LALSLALSLARLSLAGLSFSGLRLLLLLLLLSSVLGGFFRGFVDFLENILLRGHGLPAGFLGFQQVAGVEHGVVDFLQELREFLVGVVPCKILGLGGEVVHPFGEAESSIVQFRDTRLGVGGGGNRGILRTGRAGPKGQGK